MKTIEQNIPEITCLSYPTAWKH